MSSPELTLSPLGKVPSLLCTFLCREGLYFPGLHWAPKASCRAAGLLCGREEEGRADVESLSFKSPQSY